MITTICFDLDQTLWDFQKTMRRALAISLEALRAARPCEATQRLTVEQMVAIREEVAAELAGQETDLERIRLAAFARTLERVDALDSKLAEHLHAVYLEHRHRGELFPEVLPTLKALRGSYRIGLLSNGNSYPARLGLSAHLDFVVFARDHGLKKPDVQLFRIVEQEASASPGKIVHVGDSLTDDVAGAQAAGWKAVLVHRDGKLPVSDVTPDARIQSLDELPRLIPRLV